ncbi:hypothetical protein, partial [Parashewanella spongiae]
MSEVLYAHKLAKMTAICVVTFASRINYLLQATPYYQPFFLRLRTQSTDVSRERHEALYSVAGFVSTYTQ